MRELSSTKTLVFLFERRTKKESVIIMTSATCKIICYFWGVQSGLNFVHALTTCLHAVTSYVRNSPKKGCESVIKSSFLWSLVIAISLFLHDYHNVRNGSWEVNSILHAGK